MPDTVDIHMLSAQLQSGNTVQFTYETTGNPGPFEVGLYPSADGVNYNPADLIATQTATPSPTNPQAPGTFMLPSPWTPDPSKPYLIVVADPDNVVSESNENNNAQSLRIPIDLVAVDVGFAPAGIFVHYEVTGRPLDTGTSIAFYWATGNSLAQATAPAASPIDILTGTAVGTHGDGVLSGNILPPPAGTTHLLAVIDPDHTIQESNESNNVVAVGVQLSPTVDLVLRGRLEIGLFGGRASGVPSRHERTEALPE